MGTTNSQKKSPPNSATTNKQEGDLWNLDQEYYDRSLDMVARVRAAKEAAQRKSEAFGDVSEYEVTTICGQKKNTPGEDKKHQPPDPDRLTELEGPAPEIRSSLRQTTLEFGLDTLRSSTHREEYE